MVCSQSRCKTFLVSSNFALMFVGLVISILGFKMKQLLSALLLIDVPLIAQSVNALITTGGLISIAGITGVGGAYSETLWLLLLHLVALGIIVVMEFCLGVAILFVWKTVENYVSNLECNTDCAATLDSLVLEYALPSAGLMLTIIFVEAMMMYSAIKLYSFLRDAVKVIDCLEDDIVAQNVQMRNVGTPCQLYAPSPHPVFSPNLNCLSNRIHPAFSTESTLPLYSNYEESPKPPEYNTLQPDQQCPPTYMEVVPSVLVNRQPRTEETGIQTTSNSV